MPETKAIPTISRAEFHEHLDPARGSAFLSRRSEATHCASARRPPLERGELPLFDACAAIGLSDLCTGRDLLLVKIQADDPLVEGYQFPIVSRRFSLTGGRCRN